MAKERLDSYEKFYVEFGESVYLTEVIWDRLLLLISNLYFFNLLKELQVDFSESFLNGQAPDLKDIDQGPLNKRRGIVWDGYVTFLFVCFICKKYLGFQALNLAMRPLDICYLFWITIFFKSFKLLYFLSLLVGLFK